MLYSCLTSHLQQVHVHVYQGILYQQDAELHQIAHYITSLGNHPLLRTFQLSITELVSLMSRGIIYVWVQMSRYMYMYYDLIEAHVSAESAVSFVILLFLTQARFLEFKIQNMVGSCDVKFPIRLEGLVVAHSQFSRCSCYTVYTIATYNLYRDTGTYM